ncbi:MAG: PD-(D/E)XK nuclease family protein [Thermoguttaceae bacterium]
MQRFFLGWDRPLLQTASEFLLDHFVQAKQFDLSDVVIALPSSRAIQRLQEILLETVDSAIEKGRIQPDWFPPQFLTVGHLFEELYPLQKPLADDLLQQLSWIESLDQLQQESPDILARVLPHVPDKNDWNMRFSLAQIFAKVHRELAEETLDFNDVAQKCREMGITDEAIRWDSLAELQKRYLEFLDSLEYWDVQTARIYAIQKRELQTRKRIVLIGVADLNRVQKMMLDQIENQVLALLSAPEKQSQHFDKYGCVVASRWKSTTIDIRDEQIEIVDTPTEQGIASAVWVANQTNNPSGLNNAETIVLGVPNDDLIPFVQQQFQQAGVKTRVVAGRSAQQTTPYKFLEVFSRLIQTREYADFADLLRFPTVENWFINENEKETFCPVLTESDKFYTDHLPRTVDSLVEQRTVKQDISSATPKVDLHSEHNSVVDRKITLQMVWKKLETVLQPFMNNESNGLRLIIRTFFSDKADYFGNRVVEEIERMLDQIAGLPVQVKFVPNPAELLDLILQQLRSIRIAAPAEKNAIEILGWLELVLDDSPFMVVTGLNEGIIPSSLSADLFLPEKLRKELQLEDNDRRLARDAYALSVLLAVRRQKGAVLLIAGRRSSTGDPLLPSRLFFATDVETIAKRVERFFSVEEKQHPVVFPGTLRAEQAESTFRPPDSRPLLRPVESMRITEFRDFLACPYRYYLRHLLKLDVLKDSDEELDAAKFGNLLHNVLQLFGAGPIRDSDSEEEIANELNRLLDEATEQQYGQTPRAVILVQREQLRYRLNAFANWQANWVAQGNRILFTELGLDQKINGKPIQAVLEVDLETRIKLRGRIDRIDVHAETGTWYLLDYKSSDSAKSPEKVHRQSGKWVDLQLPLYRHVLQQSVHNMPQINQLAVGYIVLPKDISQTGFLQADWTKAEWEDAVETARSVVRKIRAEHFGSEFMSPIPPAFSEIYAAICGS